MCVKIKVSYLIVGVVLLGSLLGGRVVLAGNPDSGSAPASTLSFSLEDLYQRLAAGTAGSQSAFTEPGSGPGVGTMHTINDIMGVAPAPDNTNGATRTQVISGTTFWGLNAASGQWGMQTGTLTVSGGGNTYNAAVPKTGQTTSYYTGDDGDLKKGVAWPNPRFTGNGDGTVTDNLTGLIWLKNANCANLTKIMTWTRALTEVTELNTTGTMNGNNCGDTSNGGAHQTDWRLPNLRELQSLVHYDYFDPAVPNTAGTGRWSAGDPFTNIQSIFYWSSTTLVTAYTNAWCVDMHYGYVYPNDKGNNVDNFAVWPVRGGQ